MAFGDLLHSQHGAIGSGALTINFTAATAGNLLIAVFARSTNSTDGTPSGWTPITSSASGNLDGSWFYKIAAGGESTITSADSASGNATGTVMEFEGPFAASPLDKTAEDESHMSSATKTHSSGTTATTSQAGELVIAFFAADSGVNMAGTTSLTNDFYKMSGDTSTARAYYCIGVVAPADIGTYETTFSTSGTGDEMYGAIATFLPASAGPDELTATDIVTGAPTVGSPALSQIHALTAGAIVTAAPALGSPALGQVHSLIASDITTPAPVLASPEIGQKHYLTPDNITTGAPILDAPALGQIHALQASDILTGAPEFYIVTIGQIHALIAADIVTGVPVLDAPALDSASSVDDLTASDIVTGAPVLGSPAIGQVHVLTADGITAQTAVLDAPQISQVHALIATGITVTPVLDHPALGQIHSLQAEPITTGPPILDAPTLSLFMGPDSLTLSESVLWALTLTEATAWTLALTVSTAWGLALSEHAE